MLEGAPEKGGGDRGEEEARGSLARSESTGDLCRFAVLRRAILQRPGDELEVYIGVGACQKRQGSNGEMKGEINATVCSEE
jgi:hypothetical protein